MKPSVKVGIALGALIVAAGGAVVLAMGYVLATGPRMRVQPNVRAYQAEVPALPAGVVTADVAGSPPPAEKLPQMEQAAAMTNPLPDTEENRQRGEIYYQYYCIFCHGELGDGNGPVGQSYVPKPADLRTAKVRGYSDGQLLRAMLTGEGHEPVLERVVAPEHRWCLVHYVRSLGGGTGR